MGRINTGGGIDDATTTTAKSISPGLVAPAGALVLLSFALNAGLTSISALSDTRGNTYSRNIIDQVNSLNSCTHIVCASRLTTALDGTEAFSITLAASRLRLILAAAAYDDIPSVTPDGAVDDNSGNSTSPSAGPSGDPAAGRALVAFTGACASTGGSSITGLSAGLTQAVFTREGTSSGERSAWIADGYVDNPGAQSPSGTIISAIWTTGVLCFAANPGPNALIGVPA